MESVSCVDVQMFIERLNMVSDHGFEYRLLTKDEWWYAATGGGKEKWAGTSNELKLNDYAWYNTNSVNKTHPVGAKKPNKFGLYDMSGNVWEWTNSYEGSRRVVCGGSWCDCPGDLRCSIRSDRLPSDKSSSIGFRLSRTP